MKMGWHLPIPFHVSAKRKPKALWEHWGMQWTICTRTTVHSKQPRCCRGWRFPDNDSRDRTNTCPWVVPRCFTFQSRDMFTENSTDCKCHWTHEHNWTSFNLGVSIAAIYINSSPKPFFISVQCLSLLEQIPESNNAWPPKTATNGENLPKWFLNVKKPEFFKEKHIIIWKTARWGSILYSSTNCSPRRMIHFWFPCPGFSNFWSKNHLDNWNLEKSSDHHFFGFQRINLPGCIWS